MEILFSWTSLIIVGHIIVIIGLSVRVIMMRLPVGTALAWIILIFFLPFAGAVIYLVLGEKRLGRKHTQRAASLWGGYSRWLRQLPRQTPAEQSGLSPEAVAVSRLPEGSLGIPILPGNRLEIMDAAEPIFRSIIADIDRAKHFCHLEFYIWNAGGTADEVCEALMRAAARGVTCRVLLDAMGSSRFLKSRWVPRLKESGVKIAVALSVSPVRMLFVRFDLRLHRKIVVIDDEMAYTGSFNLVDPRFFKQEAGVGQWVDAMARIEGPAVLSLNAIFMWDWEVETGRDLKTLPDPAKMAIDANRGPAACLQVIPSGPGSPGDSIHQLLLMAIYAARKELSMTTPYFVPDEAITVALLSAARRGIAVTLILPAKNDSRLVHYTCRSHFDELLAAGVRIFGFKGGLLHTKSAVVDRQISLFGTVNLDVRSFWLDFEVTLCVYDSPFAERLLALQQKYIEDSVAIDLDTWRRRPATERFSENLARLCSPLL
jgi:cardiolipin synthase A/B